LQTDLDISYDTRKETYNIKESDMQTDRDWCYEHIASNGGITLRELAELKHCHPNDISGRITELHKQGFIVADGKRYLPNYKGRMYPHTVWRAKI